MSQGSATWGLHWDHVGPTSVRGPALPAQSPDCSPRTHGAQPVAVLRLALHPGGTVRKGGEAPLRVLTSAEVACGTAARDLHGPGLLGRVAELLPGIGVHVEA